MKDITNPKLLYLKGILFLVLGIGSGALIICENPKSETIFLLVISIWAFCRAYYFAFYVIEKYIDSKYKFSGLISFLKYIVAKKKS
jgi:hypothetical protein